ncbi:MAG: hypothetical protein OXC61_10815 [Flavobacteriaceae bacterium]|nr:hypothetical protein [Flavobacteriaceae bacterium]
MASERNQKVIDGVIRYHRTREQRSLSDAKLNKKVIDKCNKTAKKEKGSISNRNLIY